ncbi:MAG: hypothetical protein NTX49_02215 [Chlamydiae bacterium]|nr:hypothetical protein [Chlamydiota bacterium]
MITTNFTIQKESEAFDIESFLHPASDTFRTLLSATYINVEDAENLQKYSKEQVLFFYKVIIKTIDALIEKKYCEFDGHTTANCCHGMALWAHELLINLEGINLSAIREEGEKKVESLEKFGHQETWLVPETLIHLARIHILKIVKKADPLRGTLTYKANLKSIAPVGTRFCNKLVDSLQKHIGNFIAHRYALFLEKLPQQMLMHGISVGTWGKYINPSYLRTDRKGVKYASSMFSMRISLAHLIASRAKVAVINDLIDSSGNLKSRHISVFEGDGANNLRPLTKNDLSMFCSQSKEPVVIFGGCVYSEEVDETALVLMMNPWLDRITNLLLACDVWYPHFPRVTDDPNFDNTDIQPKEASLQKIINDHSTIHGVSAKNPSLFCLAHIYVGSFKQVLEVLEEKNKDSLPYSFIPSVKLG